MSEPSSSQDLCQLTSAVQQLTAVAEGLSGRYPHSRLEEESRLERAWHRHWFVVKESSIVPFVPLKYLKSPPKLEVESGPPPLPDFCVSAVEKDLNLAVEQARVVASAVFTAGFWARVRVLLTRSTPAISSLIPSRNTGCCVVPQVFLISSWCNPRQRQFSCHRTAKRLRSWRSSHPLLR